jgi:hypothetical protein
MVIAEREEVKAKGTHHIFNKITENFPNLEKSMPIQVEKACRTPIRLDQIELAHDILSLKQQTHTIEKEY